MQIAARFQLAKDLKSIGEYKWRPLLLSVLGGISALTVFATITPEMLPTFALGYQKWLVDIGRTAILIGAVSGVILAQTKENLLPDLPAPDAASPDIAARRNHDDGVEPAP